MAGVGGASWGGCPAVVSSPTHCHPAISPPCCRLASLLPYRPLVLPPNPCGPYSTRDPPHEQLLMRLGAGGVSSSPMGVRRGAWCHRQLFLGWLGGLAGHGALTGLGGCLPGGYP